MARKTAAQRRAAEQERRRMPVLYRWVELDGPTAAEESAAKERGEEALSFEGWKIKLTSSIKLGLLSKAMRALARTAELEELTKDSDEEIEYTADQVQDFTEGYVLLIDMCKEHVVDWDFVGVADEGEAGEPIPYSKAEWDLLPTELVLASFRAVQSVVNQPPKGNSKRPTP